MSWNYRIFRHSPRGQEDTYALHEAYYEKGPDGKVEGWTQDSICGHFESVEELISSLELMLKDAKRTRDDILEYQAEEDLDNSLNPGHYLEMVDRAHMAREYMNSAFEGHPAIDAHKSLRNWYKSVQTSLGALYDSACRLSDKQSMNKR